MLRDPVDLNLFYALHRQEIGIRKIGSQHQQQIGIVNGLVSSAISQQAVHSHRIRVIMLDPLLAAKRIAHGRLKRSRQIQHFLSRVAATLTRKNRHVPGGVDHFR